MIFNENQKTIVTERLLLRMFEKSDAAAVTELCNNYNIYKSTLNLPFPYEERHALPWIARHAEQFKANQLYQFAITDKKSEKLLGSIALSNNHAFKNGELAYWIGEPYWGNGYATEAAQALVDFAFTEKGYHKVFARCFATNPASEKVLLNIGMTKEGVLTDQVIKENKYEDLIHYGIIEIGLK